MLNLLAASVASLRDSASSHTGLEVIAQGDRHAHHRLIDRKGGVREPGRPEEHPCVPAKPQPLVRQAQDGFAQFPGIIVVVKSLGAVQAGLNARYAYQNGSHPAAINP